MKRTRQIVKNKECIIVICSLFLFAQHGQTLTGVSPEHAQIVGSV